jgi:type I restriction enzyme, S subunit
MEMLGDHIEIQKGKLPKNLSDGKSKIFQYPYVDIKAFEKGIIQRYTDGEKCLLCNDDDLLIVWDGARCGLIGKALKGAVGSTLAVVRPKKTLAQHYLYYFLQAQFHTFNTRVKGVGIPHLDPLIVHRSSLLIPSLPEQHRIVAKIEELFSELDKGIESLKTAQQQLKTYRQSVLKWAFEGRFTNIDVKEGKLPEGWKWVKIEDATISLDNMRKPINKTERQKRIGKIPYYGANGQVGWIDDYIFNEDLICVVEDETFTGREIPFSYKISGKTWVNNHAHVLKPKEGFDIDFLNYQLAYYPFLKLTTGTTGRKKLTKKALMNAPIKTCPIEEQNRVVQELESRLSVCDKLEETITGNLQQCELLRQSILKKAFEGGLG